MASQSESAPPDRLSAVGNAEVGGSLLPVVEQSTGPKTLPDAWKIVDDVEVLMASGKGSQAEVRIEELFRQCLTRSECGAVLPAARATMSMARGEFRTALSLLDDDAAVLGSRADDESVARVLLLRAQALRRTGHAHAARTLSEDALQRATRVGSQRLEGRAFHRLASTMADAGENLKALDLYESSLQKHRSSGDHLGTQRTLIAAGNILSDLGEKETALDYFRQGLSIALTSGDRSGEAMALDSIAIVTSDLGKKRDALDSLRNALRIYRAIGDRAGEAQVLSDTGAVLADLMEWKRALEYHDKSLAIRQELGDRHGEAWSLNNTGVVYSDLGAKEEAIARYEKALSIWDQVGNPSGKALTLSNMGVALAHLNDHPAALEAYNTALAAWRYTGNRAGQALALTNIGATLQSLGDRRGARAQFEQALPVWREVGDRSWEAMTLSFLAISVSEESRAGAILFAKQAVNLYQLLRSDAKGIGPGIEDGYARSFSGTYRLLANLLLDQGRVAEAQSVLEALKEDELARLLQRSGNDSSRAPLTKQEAVQGEQYYTLVSTLTVLQVKAAKFRRLRDPSSVQRAELEKLETQIGARQEELRTWFAGLPARLEQVEHKKKDEEREMASISRPLKQLGAGTVAVYTVVEAHRVRLIVFTGEGAEDPREVSISVDTLGERILALRQLLVDDRSDVEALKKESAALWDILLRPIDDTLERLNTKTILWWLDGPLRYVPVSALWDVGRGTWLAERFRSGTITFASLVALGEKPSSSWTALAMGVSKVVPGLPGNDRLKDLSSVPGELRAVVHSSKSPQGALAGVAIEDKEFTLARFQEELRHNRPVVHVASHYVFQPVGEGSFLLLGDGSHLTLKDIDRWKGLPFYGVELLTLSACETAVGSHPSELAGAEVDGLSMVAQQKGAAAVLATLWPVNDPATARFMGEFYARRQQGLTKLEALRQTQLAFLRGMLALPKLASTASPATARKDDGPVSPRGAEEGWTHPYYWAPFILLGNGL
jgi:CHAT domain-containing protein/Tfp pilus assembly protein PilF